MCGLGDVRGGYAHGTRTRYRSTTQHIGISSKKHGQRLGDTVNTLIKVVPESLALNDNAYNQLVPNHSIRRSLCLSEHHMPRVLPHGSEGGVAEITSVR